MSDHRFGLGQLGVAISDMIEADSVLDRSHPFDAQRLRDELDLDPRYPLGAPSSQTERVKARRDRVLHNIDARRAKLQAVRQFEQQCHPNPDGSKTAVDPERPPGEKVVIERLRRLKAAGSRPLSPASEWPFGLGL